MVYSETSVTSAALEYDGFKLADRVENAASEARRRATLGEICPIESLHCIF